MSKFFTTRVVHSVNGVAASSKSPASPVFLRTLQRFVKDRRGSFASIFALATLPLAASLGASVDYSRAAALRTKLQAATDAAALSIARQEMVGGVGNEELARRIIDANLTMNGTQPWTLEGLSSTNGRVLVQTKATVQALFLSHLRFGPLEVSAEAEVKKGKYDLEVALALDNTGSMAANDRIGKLRTAALKLVDVLEAARTPTNNIKISLVPFVTSVNIKSEGFSMNWMDQSAQSDFHGVNFEPTGSGARVNHFDLFNNLSVAWKGCVEARPEPFDISDDAPTGSNPKTQFVPYFWPDEPDSGQSYAGGTSYNNNYLSDGVAGNNASARQRATAKYTAGGAVIDDSAPQTSGPNKSCPTPVLPLTSDFVKARTEISAMREWNESGTNIAEGLAWAWRTLLPDAFWRIGKPYNTPGLNKAIILLTDGENVVWGGWNSHNKSDYNAYNFLSHNRLNSTDKDVAGQRVNSKVATLCQSIKAKGVTIYTITLELGSSALQNLFRTCATDPNKYYNSPDASQLDSVFRTIASDLVALHVSR